jgi:hypothetical protein
MLSNRTGATPELALTWNEVPGVAKTAPRGELTLKKFAGRAFGAANASGTPSQLISLRPDPKLPATFGLSVPKLTRKVSTVVWMAALLAPTAEKISGAAMAGGAARPT